MTKKRRPERAAAVCAHAIKRVDEALANHKAGRPEDLSVEVLQNVRQELERMSATLDSGKYAPSYGRFILDWPDEHGLIEALLQASQDYQRWT